MFSDREMSDFFALVVAAGYRKSDFAVTAGETYSPGGTGPTRSRVIVTRVSDGTMRAYLASEALAWITKFLTDLKNGVYGPAPMNRSSASESVVATSDAPPITLRQGYGV